MINGKVAIFIFSIFVLITPCCRGPESEQPILTVEVPLHLEEHLDSATTEGSEVPKDVPAPVEWNFNEPQPGWGPAIPINQTTKPVKVLRTEDALRVILNESNFDSNNMPYGGIYIDLPSWNREDWAYILVHARTSEKIHDFCIGFNLLEQPATPPRWAEPFCNESEWAPMITDGSVQTYLIRADYSPGEKWEGKWEQLGLWFHALEPAKVDILSVSVIPKEAIFASAPVGVRTEIRSNSCRRTLYTHVPGRLKYKVRVPKAGRFDVGLGVLQKDDPVTFRVKVMPEGGEFVSLFEEAYADREHWAQRSVDLSSMSGQVVTLALETDSERGSTVALWSAPTLSGSRSTKKPNIIFYIIDGAGADQMSVYDYNRRTTPNLERLAAEGAIFEHAYSNCSWTKVSNPSFMTSLYHSVLGGYKSDSDRLPDQAVAMAQHFHKAGYETAVFTTNTYAGMLTGFERGVDVLREDEFGLHSISSRELQEQFWRWRAAYPSEPYWVHFQTTDVHGPSWKAVAPFSGLFISPEQRKRFYEWLRQMNAAGFGVWGFPYTDVWEKTGISQQEFSYIRRGLYDETMAHNDYQIGQLVKRLKAAGEWDHTLLIIASDHGHENAGCFQLNPLPPKWGSPLFASFRSRIPMIFIWPERITPGQRFSQQVSMIDMLPTILDLAGMPMPEVMQGQSLAPLLLGGEGWEPRPVILDEFYIDRETGELNGKIDVVDGRWGASLTIGKNIEPEGDFPPEPRPAPLLLYDLWNDPYCLQSLHEQRPDLVEKYTKFLEDQWKVHQTLAKQFTRPKDSPLTPEQLEILRSLGYIQ